MKKIISIALILSIITSVSGCAGTSATTNANISVKTQQVTSQKVTSNIDIVGVLNPDKTENIAMKMSGTVKTINLNVGDTVKKGDSLITLDSKELEASLSQATAAYNSAKSNVALAKVNLDAASTGINVTNSALADQRKQAQLSLDAAQQGLDAANASAKDQLATAQLALTNATTNYNRVKPLFDAGASSKSEMDAITHALDMAKSSFDLTKTSTDASILAAKAKYDATKAAFAQTTGSGSQGQIVASNAKYEVAKKQYEISNTSTIASAQAGIDSIKVQLSNAVAVSDIDGVVVNKNINQGEMAAAGSPLLTIADISTLRLRGTIPQTSIPFVKKGQEIDVVVDIYPNDVFKGTVESVGPISVSSSSFFPIEISLKNVDSKLTAGLSARATLKITGAPTLTVANSSIVINNGQTYVFAIENGLAVKKDVTVGLKGDKESEITRGLKEGDIVATSNVNVLQDSMPVDVTK